MGAGPGALLLSILAHRVSYFPRNVRITRSIQAADVRALALPPHALSAPGFPPRVDVVYAGIIVVLFAFRRRWESVSAGLDVLGGDLLVALGLTATDLSYPSGGRRSPRQHAQAYARRGHHGLLLCLMLLLASTFIGSAAAATVYPDSLAASAEVPWNPPQPLPRRNRWERVVLLPGQLISLPLSGLGYLTDRVLFRLEQNPPFASGLMAFLGPGQRTLVLKPAKLGDRTGLGGAVELRAEVLPGALESRVSAAYAGTLNRYNQTLLTWTGRPASLQYGYEWRPRDRFFGIGNDTPVAGVSDHANQAEFVRGGLAWTQHRASASAQPASAVNLWGGPRSRVTRSGRESGEFSLEARYLLLGAATLDRRVENLVYGASLLHDRRSGSPHWSHGVRALLSAERFDVPMHALALHSGVGDGAQFTRYQAEAEAGMSFMRDPRTVRFLVRMADQQVSSGRDRFLVSDLSTLGGQAGLGGYSPGRFHDLDLLLTRLDYVFPLGRRLELDLNSEWGGVYPDLWNDAKLVTLHSSFGFSLRVRDDRAPRGSIGLDFSREAINFRFALGGVE